MAVGWLALCASAYAQTALEMKRDAISSMVGTLYTKTTPSFSGGKLDGCTMEYGAVIRDWYYRRGDFVIVGGGFGLLSGSGKFGAFLKVIFHDYDPQTMEPYPNAPEEAAFIFGNATNRADVLDTFKADVPGGLVVVFTPMPTLGNIIKQVVAGQVTLAVARKRGLTAIVIPIDTAIEETLENNQKKRSQQAQLGFLNCSQQFVENMQAAR